MEEITLPHFEPEQEVWIEMGKNHDSMWQKAKIVEQTGVFVICLTESGRALNLDLRDDSVFSVNPSSHPDMTSLHFINEPGILFNLEERSLNDQAYTFMSSVLVAVNPLKPLKNPKIDPHKKFDSSLPHPYSVASNAFLQMTFAFDNAMFGRVGASTDFDQSVVTSGESGAGKTECCKMVLRFLVDSLNEGGAGADTIDVRLLESNHITESFGNAQTLRNHNSSRFGKFMKLHFNKSVTEKGRGHRNLDWEIIGASVETYLLERSRVSLHNQGERNFHVFHQLYSGIKSKVKELKSHVDSKVLENLTTSFKVAENSNVGFRLLSPLTKSEDVSDKKGFLASVKPNDAKELSNVLQAMEKLDFGDSISGIFQVVAGIMHLGNLVFDEKMVNNTETAVVDESVLGAYDPVGYASDFLGIDKELLVNLVTREELVIRKQKVVRIFDRYKASFTRDALCKALYSCVFDFVISQIDTALTLKRPENDEDSKMPFIGILDIFGFESFKRNDFEQLLINFANEALQATFNRSVFENEAELYKRERLILDSADVIRAPSNSACMTLFVGEKADSRKGKGGKESMEVFAKRRGLLLAIDDESQGIEPSDKKMLANLHRQFGKHPDWKKPHPKQRQEVFIIQHFAGDVKYSIGYFLEKNRDELPKSIVQVFSKSTSKVLSDAFSGRITSGSKKQRTIITKFRTQISELVDTLESTKCSFIRCVKPNEEMSRGKGSKWFNRRYISHQLRNLSIPQTAEVLQNGFPTRLTYASLMDSYMKLIPEDAMKGYKKLVERGKASGSGEVNLKESLFVKSLLFAFEVEQKCYKLGLTMVFFKSGELARLDKILQSASNFESFEDKARVVKRFRYYFVRLRWREVYAKVFAFNRFKKILEVIRERERLRQEQIRLEKERLEREKAEKEKLEKEREQQEELENQRLQQMEKEREEEEQRIKQELEDERIRREKNVEEAEKTSEGERIADLYDKMEDEANDIVKTKFLERGGSVTSLDREKATREEIEKLESAVAQREAQSRMEERLQNFYTDLMNNSKDFWSKARENIKEGLKGWDGYWTQMSENISAWTDNVGQSDVWQGVKRRHNKRMKILKRTINVTNRLLLKQARQAEWFKDAEERLNLLQARIRHEFEMEMIREEGLDNPEEAMEAVEIENLPDTNGNINHMETRVTKKTVRSTIAGDRSTMLNTRYRIEGNHDGLRHMASVVKLDRQEIQTGQMSAIEHIDKVKQMIEQGVVPPSALGDLITVMERSSKVKKSIVPGQHIPANSDNGLSRLSSSFDSPFPNVNPSDDLENDWSSSSLGFHKGNFYVSTNPRLTRAKKLSILCGWEHANSVKKGRLYSHWDVDLSPVAWALIYDAILSAQDARVKRMVKKVRKKIPDFPGWDAAAYQKQQRRASKPMAMLLFGSPGYQKSRGDRMKVVSNCLDESVLLEEPRFLGLWLSTIFTLLNDVDASTGDALLLQVPLIMELFDIEIYGGVENL